MKKIETTKSQKVAIAVIGVCFFAAFLGLVVRPMLEEKIAHPDSPKVTSQFESSWIEKLFGDNPKLTPTLKPTPKEYTAPDPKYFLPVEWPDPSTIDWELRNQLPKQLIEKIDQSPVPVLMPSNPGYIEKSRLVVENYRTDLFYSQGSSNYFYFGIFAMPTIDNETIPGTWQSKLRGRQAQFVQSYEDTWWLQWFENGILYNLKLTCHPKICKDESSVFDLANSLRYVGGKYAQGGAE